MFNAVRMSLDVKVDSVRGRQQLRVDHPNRRMARAEQDGLWVQVHRKKRRLESLKSDVAVWKIRLSFGSRRLSRKQRHLAANGCISHDEWFRDWRKAGSDELFGAGQSG